MSELSNDEMSKVTITAFIEEDLKEGLKALADVERRSMSQMVAVLIERAVNDAAKQGLISDSATKGK
ncbi:MAG: hypothetical protein DCF22_26060 [Leptolyngbya sp.]|nr:MAG: hypothetical protein DCF22_26060 [Leptolyngbya sp.]